MTRREQLRKERAERLRAAEAAQGDVEEQGRAADRQLSLVGRLSEGWSRVHEYNHLAELFHPKGNS